MIVIRVFLAEIFRSFFGNFSLPVRLFSAVSRNVFFTPHLTLPLEGRVEKSGQKF